MKSWGWALVLALPLAGCERTGEIEIANAWARDSVGRTANAAVFLTITSPAADRLVGASAASVAQKTDLMTMKTGNHAMAMDYLAAIAIPAGTPVKLHPAGLHVWLEDLREPLRAGQTFPLTLEFERAGQRRVTVSVIAPAAAPPV